MSEKIEAKSAYDRVNVDATFEKLVEQIGTKKEAETRITQKIQALDGFVTRIGAMQLVARELGINIVWKDKEIDLTKVYPIRLSELPEKPVGDYVEVEAVITRASEMKVSKNKRSFQHFTIDDGETALDLIVFGQAKCGMFQSWMDQRVLIYPLKIGLYQGTPQLQVVDKTEIQKLEAQVEEPPTSAPKEGGT